MVGAELGMVLGIVDGLNWFDPYPSSARFQVMEQTAPLTKKLVHQAKMSWALHYQKQKVVPSMKTLDRRETLQEDQHQLESGHLQRQVQREKEKQVRLIWGEEYQQLQHPESGKHQLSWVNCQSHPWLLDPPHHKDTGRWRIQSYCSTQGCKNQAADQFQQQQLKNNHQKSH